MQFGTITFILFIFLLGEILRGKFRERQNLNRQSLIPWAELRKIHGQPDEQGVFSLSDFSLLLLF